jgi:GNAT superfamily N-acetyltransferase
MNIAVSNPGKRRPAQTRPGPLVLRIAGPKDWAVICALHDRARAVELQVVGSQTTTVPLARDPEFGPVVARATCILAVIRDEAVGFAAVDGASIEAVYVCPRFHGMGIGRRLLADACGHAGRTAHAIVLQGNAPSLGLFRASGFAVTGTRVVVHNGVPFDVHDLAMRGRSRAVADRRRECDGGRLVHRGRAHHWGAS